MTNADQRRPLDHKLRQTAKALKSWSTKHVGSIRLQLHVARAMIVELDAGTAQDFKALSELEIELRKDLKCGSLGLATT